MLELERALYIYNVLDLESRLQWSIEGLCGWVGYAYFVTIAYVLSSRVPSLVTPLHTAARSACLMFTAYVML